MHRIILCLCLLMIFLIPSERIIYVQSLGTISNVIGLIIAGIWCIHFLANGVRNLTAFHALVGVFLFLNAISLFWSVDPDSSLIFLFRYVRLAGLTVIIWDVFRTTDYIRLGLQSYVLGGLIPAASTISNYLNDVEGVYGRYAATTGFKNETAFILAMTIPAALYLAVGLSRNWGPRWLSWFNFVCAFVSLFAISLTASRFAIIMTVPVWLYLLTSVLRFRPVNAVTVVAATIGGLLLVSQLVPEPAFNRLTTIHTEIATGDLTGRTTIWKLGLQSFFRHPWLGIGAGADGTPCVFALGRPVSMHGSFLTVLVDLGVVGLLAMVSILGIVALCAWRMPRNDSIFWLTVLAAWGLGNLVCSDFDTKHTWLFLSLLVAHWGAIRDRGFSENPALMKP